MGSLGYRFLSVAALPTVEFPTIQVVTNWPGAAPDIVQSAISAPLETGFGRIPGLTLDDVDELIRHEPDHAAIQADAANRIGGAGRAGGHQRGRGLASDEPAAVPTDLSSDQSGGHAGPGHRAHV